MKKQEDAAKHGKSKKKGKSTAENAVEKKTTGGIKMATETIGDQWDGLTCRSCGGYMTSKEIRNGNLCKDCTEPEARQMKKTQINRKHIGKKLDVEQTKEVTKIQKEMIEAQKRPVAWLEAKHIYFEKLEGSTEPVAEKEPKKKKGPMTIAETKLGVTMVLSKEDCKKIGIPETETTKEAIKQIRFRLGFQEKK